jgi:5S rRNA maturation endonuclease (ribonuclease M5)
MKSDPTSAEIQRVIGHLRVRKHVGNHVIADCVACSKQDHLYINIDTGLWDCFTGDTRIVTRKGTFPIGDLSGQHVEILSHLGWVEAPIKSGGTRDVYAITLERDRARKTIRATDGHRWILKSGKEVLTRELVAGMKLASSVAPRVAESSVDGIRHGIMFGDGDGRGQCVELYGPKQNLSVFLKQTTVSKIKLDSGVDGLRVNGQDPEHKIMPSLKHDDAYLLGWLQGYFATDGTAYSGSPCIDSADKTALERVRDACNRVGIATSPIGSYWRKGFPGYEGFLHRVTLRRASLWPGFFLREDQRDSFLCHGSYEAKRLSWRVVSVEPVGREDVYCAVVPDAETFTLEDNILTGNCKKCQESGSIWSLATKLGLRLRESSGIHNAGSAMRRASKKKTVYITDDKLDHAHARIFNVDDDEAQSVRAYIYERGFDDDTIRRFKLCAMRIGTEPAVGIPYLAGGKAVLFKLRNLATNKTSRKFTRYPNGADSPLFNLDGIRDAKQVVLVEGELDAISLWQLGITNAASTSLGAQKTFPVDWLDMLSDADDIVLWYDDDESGQKAVATLSEILGSHRCRVASISEDIADAIRERIGKTPKDANDLLVGGATREQVKAIVDAAEGEINTTILKRTDYTPLIDREVSGAASGLGIRTGWDNFDELIRGIRTSELTVITGFTGHGKSTWTLELMERISKLHNEPVLISSLENKPITAVLNMFQRKLGYPISAIKTDEQRQSALSKVERLNEEPVFVLDLFGRQPLSILVDRLRCARHRYGIRFAMIDHLGFILKEDQRQDQISFLEHVLNTLNEEIKRLDMGLLLLCHPMGINDESILPTGGKGSSSIAQLADNGITVFRSRDIMGTGKLRKMSVHAGNGGQKIDVTLGPNTTLVYIWKKRHRDATEGVCLFDFSVAKQTYTDVGKPGAQMHNLVDISRPYSEVAEPAFVAYREPSGKFSDEDPFNN